MSGAQALSEAAIGFARCRWHVFPLASGSKGQSTNGTSAQLLSNGHKGASSDPEVVASWWKRWPDANIGLSLAISGLVAIDIDAYKPQCGWNAFAADRDTPPTFTQRSARGGRHLVFAAPSGARFAGRLCEGVDVKHKGYILLAPSTFEGRPYTIIDDRPPTTAPDWLASNSTAVPARPGCGARQAVAASTSEVVELLDWINPDTGYHDWIAVLQALHDHFGGSVEGLALAEDWSSRATKFVSGEVARKWSGFRAGAGVSLATIAYQARKNGADLARIARRHNASVSLGPSDGAAPPTTPADGTPDLSHDALALALGRESFDAEAKFIASQKLWYFWTGTHWEADDALRVMTQTRAFLRNVAAEVRANAVDPGSRATTRTTDHLKSHATVSAVAMLARANPGSVARVDDFDRDILLLGTPDGTVDLRDGTLSTARREQVISRQTVCGPAAQGTVPERWLTFLHEVMGGDAEILAFLQRAAGYALTGSTAEHKLLFLHGSGRNGKSVFLNTLLDLWGSYGRRVPAATFLSGQVERHPTDLASLRGARLAVASELPRGKTWDEAVVKDLTGGDRMTARFMRQDFFEFEPNLTLMVAGNTQPSFRGVDDAIRARVVLVPFAVTIPQRRRDPKLPEALRAEFPAILRWCVDGALEWQRRGLAVPETLLAASQDYFDAEDIVGQFLAEETLNDPGAVTAGTDLIFRFNRWTDAQGLDAWTQRNLVKELKTRGYEEGRRSGFRGLKGLRLR
jgi:P4 family phage/plasmid primase-like protien